MNEWKSMIESKRDGFPFVAVSKSMSGGLAAQIPRETPSLTDARTICTCWAIRVRVGVELRNRYDNLSLSYLVSTWFNLYVVGHVRH